MNRAVIILDGISLQKHHHRYGRNIDYRRLTRAIADRMDVDRWETYYFALKARETGAQDVFLDMLRSCDIVVDVVPFLPGGLDMGKIMSAIDAGDFDVVAIVSSAPREFQDLIKNVRKTTGVMVVNLDPDSDRWQHMVDETFTLEQIENPHYPIMAPEYQPKTRSLPQPRSGRRPRQSRGR